MQIGCGFAAVAGHLFPVWLKFKGGKGAATGIGVVFALNWIAGASAVGAFLLAFALTRIVSVGSILGAVAAPVVHAFTGGRFRGDALQVHLVTGFLAVMSIIVIVRHRDNIRRLLKGEERRFTFGRESESHA